MPAMLSTEQQLCKTEQNKHNQINNNQIRLVLRVLLLFEELCVKQRKKSLRWGSGRHSPGCWGVGTECCAGWEVQMTAEREWESGFPWT